MLDERNIAAFDLTAWTPIARQRANGVGCRWIPVDDTPMSVQEAQTLQANGTLLMAQRVDDAGTWLVVKERRGLTTQHTKRASQAELWRDVLAQILASTSHEEATAIAYAALHGEKTAETPTSPLHFRHKAA
jgi:hypothetical protein